MTVLDSPTGQSDRSPREQTETILEKHLPKPFPLPMDVRIRLVHADAQHRVVMAQAFEDDHCLGTALGEATSAEVAEDRARDRLRLRLHGSEEPAGRPPPEAPSPEPLPKRPESPAPLPTGRDRREPQDPPADPEDWSADLARLDRLLGQLGWGRGEERIYLQRLFGQPSRSRLTRHADLMALQRALQSLPPGSVPETAPLPMLRSELLAQCDALLSRLGWPTERARECLERHFSLSSRQRLSDDQLLAFNLLLEGELLERPQGQTEPIA